jgi:hypothetical protein
MASTRRSASARKSGKPSTVPSALTASAGQWRRAGSGARTAQQPGHAEQPGHRGAAGGDEGRRQLRRGRIADRQPRHRQRGGEDQHAHAAQQQAARGVAVGDQSGEGWAPRPWRSLEALSSTASVHL